MMNWIAVDIGGANLKIADGRGFADSYPFSMWKDSKRLSQELRTIMAESPAADHLAVTMTGELADCFESKGAGVTFILDAVQRASDGRHTRVYLNNGMLVTTQVASLRPLEVAAANWHALAAFACRYVQQDPALLIDLGSTTCDIIPLMDGQVAAAGKSDTERLLTQELVYTGVERTPICAIASRLPYRGQMCPSIPEWFATARDAYVLLGLLPEDPLTTRTADGRPSTKANARVRLARMIGADGEIFNHRDAVIAAQAVADGQAQQIAGAIHSVASRMPTRPTVIVSSGAGEFVIRRALESSSLQPRLVSLSAELSSIVSRCAPAHALAVLAREASTR